MGRLTPPQNPINKPNVLFDESIHKYTLKPGGDALPGVTSAIGDMRSVNGVAIMKTTLDGNLIPNLSLDRASARGTAVHKAIEDYLNEHGTNNKAKIIKRLKETHGEKASQSFEQFLKFEKEVLAKGGYEIVGTEVMHYSSEHGFAGTMDLVVRDKHGNYSIIDFKTGAVSEHVGQQLAAYEHLIRDKYSIGKDKTVRRFALDIKSNQSDKWYNKDEYILKEITTTGDFETFVNNLEVFKGVLGSKDPSKLLVSEEEAANALRQKIKDEVWIHGKPQMTWLPQSGENLTQADNALLDWYKDIYAEAGWRMDPYKLSAKEAGKETHYGTSYKLTKSPFIIPTSRNKKLPFGHPDSSPKTKAVNSTGRTAQGSGASIQPVNTIKPHIYLDLEVSGLEIGMPRRAFDALGHQRPGALSEISARHAHSSIVQIGVTDALGRTSGSIIHDFKSPGAPSGTKISKRFNNVSSTIYGQTKSGHAVTVKNVTGESEVEQGLKGMPNMYGEELSPSQIASWMHHHGKEELNKEQLFLYNPDHGFISTFSEKAARTSPTVKKAELSKLGYHDVDIISQEHAWGKGGAWETRLRAMGMVSKTKVDPFIIASHGTTLDTDKLRHMFSIYNPEFSELIEGGVNEGAIKFWDTAFGWHELIYGLAKEDKSFAGKIRIPYNSQASKITGAPHEAGRVAKTLEEYMVSTKYNLQGIIDTFSWWKPIKEKLGGKLTVLHDAPPDTAITREADALMTMIKEKANELAVTDGLTNGLSNITESQLESKKYYSRAVSHFMGQDQSELKGASSNTIRSAVGSIKSAVARQSISMVKNSGAVPTNVKSGKFRGGPKMVDLHPRLAKIFPKGISVRSAWGNGVLGGAAAFMVASTYMSSRDETKTSIIKTLGNTLGLRRITNFAKRYLDIGDPYSDSAPFTHSQLFTKVIPGVTMLAATTYLAGLRRAKMSGNLLGVTEKTAEHWTDAVKGFGKTMRLGVREIEENFPVTRVFKTGSVIDYMFGSRNYGEIGDTGVFKSMQFNIFDHSDYTGKVGPTKWKSHTAVDSFIDASRLAGDSDADKLHEFLNADYRKSGYEKITIRFTKGKNGETLVFSEGYNEAGEATNLLSTSHNVKANFSKLQTGKTRNLEAFIHHKKEAMQNIPVLDHAQYEAYRLGNYKKIGYKEYRSRFTKPDFAKGIMSPVWEFQKWMNYHLEIDAKGISESKNNFYVLNEVQGILKQNIIPVKLLGDKFHWLDNLAVRLRFAKPIALEGILAAGNRFMETPFEALSVDPRWIKRSGEKLRASHDLTKRIAGKALQFIERPHLGLNIHRMKYGAPQYLAELGLKRLLPAYLGLEALRAVDHLLGKLTFSPTGAGPLSTSITKPFEYARMAYAKISDLTGMTGVSKRQEQFAPGSTSLGFFALPTTAVSVYSVGKMLYKHAPTDLRRVGDAAIKALKTGRPMGHVGRFAGRIDPIINNVAKNPTLRTAMSMRANKTPMQKILSFMVKNPKLGIFTAAMLPLAPFVPGLLGSSKSYAEVRDEYSGKRDIAIRKHRGWLLSSEPLQGSNVETYRKHFTALQGMDWENKVIWPSYGARLAHNLTGGLYGRYMLEDYHRRDNPVYQSAPYGAGIPVIGSLIAGTIGHLIKPTRDYAYTHGTNPDLGSIDINPKDRALAIEMHRKAQSLTISAPHGSHDVGDYNVADEAGFSGQMAKFIKSSQELSGFKGFVSEMTMQAISGKSRQDEFTPYRKSAQSFYDPAQYMWQYEAGDVSFVGGEFLRRILQSPYKKWEINDLPNEFMGQKWIPQSMQTGTTYDKASMGWLYATRRGWEQLFPEIAGKRMSDYAPNIKTEILKHIAPHSEEFKNQALATASMAKGNMLSPQQEQRYYETMSQVATMREKLYVHKEQFATRLDTESVSGNITSFNEQDLTFTVDNYGSREFRLAGISNDLNDLRSRLLKRKVYDSAGQLDDDAQSIMANMKSAIARQLQAGNRINMEILGGGAFSGREFTEAIVGNLNDRLLDMGAPLANTGNLAEHNMLQDRSVIGSHLLAKYWDSVNSSHTFFAKKMVAERNYIDNYVTNRVFNKDVKLWNHPVEHFIKPLISSLASNVGIRIIPSFTARRRGTQQYWDTLKYIKYKNLETEAMKKGHQDDAQGYAQMVSQTMIGVNPMKATDEEIEMTLPGPERPYFKYFANEPDAKKRRKIAKYVPGAELRILEALWIRKRVESGARVDAETQRAYEILQQSKGYLLSDDDLDEYQSETGGNQPLDKYVRQKTLTEYLKKHKTPDHSWGGWLAETNMENVEVHALQEMGEQVQDYGYFETQLRSAAYDRQAYIAASQLNSQILSKSSGIGTILANVMSEDYDDSSYNMPTTSMMPQSINNIATNAMDKHIMKSGSFMHLLDDVFIIGSKLLKGLI